MGLALRLYTLASMWFKQKNDGYCSPIYKGPCVCEIGMSFTYFMEVGAPHSKDYIILGSVLGFP